VIQVRNVISKGQHLSQDILAETEHEGSVLARNKTLIDSYLNANLMYIISNLVLMLHEIE
jgi:hypothetical protein